MWIVEVNFAGRRFTHEVHARRPTFRFSPRSFGWRPSQLRDHPRGLTFHTVGGCSVCHHGQDPHQARVDAHQYVDQRRRGNA